MTNLQVFLLLVALGSAFAAAPVRIKNGVRLVGGSGSKGRVEVLTDTPYFTAGAATGYVPLCDSSFNDGTAQVLCEMLGYKYGRKYYSPKVNYLAANEASKNPGGSLWCYSGSSHRRLLTLRGGSSGGGAGGSNSGRALAPLVADLLSNSSAPYKCTFFVGDCDPRGPLAGIECSGKAFPPAPPPPPSPPSAPPAPPPTSESIQIIGRGTYPGETSVEPNLCPNNTDLCDQSSRVELLVKSPGSSGSLVFAPLCGINNTDLADTVADIVCQQAFDWPRLLRVPPIFVWPHLSFPPYFRIPKGKVTGEGKFNPAKVPAWVTVTGKQAGVTDPRRIQDLKITISKSPCKSGTILAMTCDVAFA